MQFLTPAGEKAVAAYDPFKDDPTFRCDPVAIRRVWGAPGTPLEIVHDKGDIVLHHEWMDVRRLIHMNMKEHPKNGPRSSLGHSIGHFGDEVIGPRRSRAGGLGVGEQNRGARRDVVVEHGKVEHGSLTHRSGRAGTTRSARPARAGDGRG